MPGKKKNYKILAKTASWTFDKNVPKKFDYHINKSVPFYQEFAWLGEKISDFYIKENSVVYDIGCSTGSFLKRLSLRHAEKKKNCIYRN